MGSGLVGGGGGSSTAICLADADYGDISASSCNLTVDANSVALGTDTTGNYVADVTAGAGGEITVSGSGESASVVVDLGTVDHGADVTGLTDDDHTQYLLLAGRATGQTAKGGTASGDDLTLQSTNHATKGNIFLDDAVVLWPSNTAVSTGTETLAEFNATVAWSGGTLYGIRLAPTLNTSTTTPTFNGFSTAATVTATAANALSNIAGVDTENVSQSATANVPPFPLHDVRVASIIQQTANSSISSALSPGLLVTNTIRAGDGADAGTDGNLTFADPNQLNYEEITAADTGTDQLTTSTQAWATGDGPFYVADGDKLCTAASTPFASCSSAQTGTAVLPGGVTARTSYWVIVVDTTHIQLATSRANAIAGTEIDITAGFAATCVIGPPGTGAVGVRVATVASATSGETLAADTTTGLHVAAPTLSGSGTVDLGHVNGIYIEEQENGSLVTYPCAICSVGASSPVKIAGKMQLGTYSDAGPTDTLEVTGDIDVFGAGQLLFDPDTTGGQNFVQFSDGTETVSAIWNLMTIANGTLTLDNIVSGLSGFAMPSTVVLNYTADPLFGGSNFFNLSPTVRNSGTSRSAAWWWGIYSHPTFGTDGSGVTTTYELAGDVDILPTFDATNSGAFAGERAGINMGVAVAAGDTFPKYTHIKIAKESGSGTLTEERGIDNASTYVASPTTQAIAAAGDNISCTEHLKTFTTATGTTTLTDNPIITDGVSGQICVLTNIDATATDCLAFTDATQGLQLGATRTMCPNDVLTLLYNGTDWVEVSWADN